MKQITLTCKFLLLLCIVFTLTNCAFHFQTKQELPFNNLKHLNTHHITDFIATLNTTLQNNGIIFTELSAYELVILNESIDTNVVSVASDGHVREKELVFTVTYTLIHNDVPIIQESKLSLNQIYNINPHAILSSNQEQKQLLSELLENISNELLHDIAFRLDKKRQIL